MKLRNISLLCCLLACLLVLVACQSARQRGVAVPSNAYVSTTRPAIQIAVPDLPLVTSGAGTGTLFDPGSVGGLAVDMWVAVYARGPQGPMAAVMHADLPEGWRWTTVHPHAGSLAVGTDIVGGTGFAGCTYLQAVASDPLAGLAGEPVKEPSAEDKDVPPAYWLVHSMASICNFNRGKIILEYREPVPADMLGTIFQEKGKVPVLLKPSPDFLAAFRDRATKAFAIGAPDGSRVHTGYPEGVRWRFLDDRILGDVMQSNIPY